MYFLNLGVTGCTTTMFMYSKVHVHVNIRKSFKFMHCQWPECLVVIEIRCRVLDIIITGYMATMCVLVNESATSGTAFALISTYRSFALPPVLPNPTTSTRFPSNPFQDL